MPDMKLLAELLRGKSKGYRPDNTEKGSGYLGIIPMKNNDSVMSELSIGVDYGSGEKLIPSITPYLSPEELDYLRGGGDPRENKSIVNKSVLFAKEREKQGKPYFIDESVEKPYYNPYIPKGMY